MPEDAFCTACGQALAMAAPAKKARLMLWGMGGLAVVVVALICLASAGVLVFARSSFDGLARLLPTSASVVALAPTEQPAVSATATATSVTGQAVTATVILVTGQAETATATLVTGQAAPTVTVAPVATATPVPPAAPTAAPTAVDTPAPAPPTSTPKPVVPTARPNTPTTTPRLPTADAAAIQREQNALVVHPGFKKYQHAGADFSVNIPSDWRALGEDGKGTWAQLSDRSGRTFLYVELFTAGQRADVVLNNWMARMNGRVVLAPMKTSMGHYEARQTVIDMTVPYVRRIPVIAASTPNGTYLLWVDAPAADDSSDIYFEAAVVSFRTPARCGTTVCTDLLPLDAAVGQPVPLPPLPAPAGR